jgi:4-hydroxy-tetrahydrodipicolinate synthase
LHRWLLDIFYGIFISTNPVPVKTALNLIGFKVGGVRLPLCEMTEDELGLFRKILGKYQLI